MNLHRWCFLLLVGWLWLPAADLQAEQISTASLLANQSAEVAEPAASSHGAQHFDFSVAADAADPFELLTSMSTVTAEAASEPSFADKPATTSRVNLTPIGIMVASSAVTVVPEPSTVILLGCGALGIYCAARRRRG